MNCGEEGDHSTENMQQPNAKFTGPLGSEPEGRRELRHVLLGVADAVGARGGHRRCAQSRRHQGTQRGHQVGTGTGQGGAKKRNISGL